MRARPSRNADSVMCLCAAMKFDANESNEASEHPEPLSKADFENFLQWVRILSVQMRLAEFDIKISPHSCETGYVAEVETDFNYHKVKISLCPQFHTFTPERQRTIMVHELLHVHMSCVKMPFEALLEVMSADAYTLTMSTALRMEEHVVTSIESALANGMPLPPVPGKKYKSGSKVVAKIKKTKK